VAGVFLESAAVFALLPVTARSPQALAECNPLSLAQYYASQTPDATASGSSYVPAIVVWLDPASAVPNGDPNAATDQSLCQSAAVGQLTPGFVLGGIGIALLIFGPIALRYVVTGQRTPAVTAMPTPGPPPGWYDDPDGNAAIQRWWDGKRWTLQSKPKSE
jgi:hypothetical protein